MSQQRPDDDPLRRLDPAAAEATRWFVALHEDAKDLSLRPQFEAWRDSDPRNAAAYARLQRLWGASGHLPSLSPPARGVDRRSVLLGAAGAVLAVGGGARLALGPHPFADYSTRPGERRTVALADGSTVELSTASAVSVNFHRAQRQVRLIAGEAFFQVTADRARPFVVDTRAGAVTALGTAFGVALDGQRASVSVTEQSAEVKTARRTTQVAAGQGLVFGADMTSAVHAVDTAALAWRQGRLVFVSKPLGEVMQALDRWTPGRTIITDTVLAARPVTLMINTADAAQGVVHLAGALPMRVTRLTPLLTIIQPV